MKTIDEQQLELDAQYRYQYLCEFIGFGAEDIAFIHASVGRLAPKIPQLVERTYERLLSYDATARHFVPRQHGHDGEVPANLAELSQQHAQIKFRKEHLLRYLMQLIGSPLQRAHGDLSRHGRQNAHPESGQQGDRRATRPNERLDGFAFRPAPRTHPRIASRTHSTQPHLPRLPETTLDTERLHHAALSDHEFSVKMLAESQAACHRNQPTTDGTDQEEEKEGAGIGEEGVGSWTTNCTNRTNLGGGE
jgi:hypothetical protein